MINRSLIECIPKVKRDRLTLAIFLLGGPFAVWFEFFIVMPGYDFNSDLVWAHKIFCAFTAVQVYWNLFYMLRTDTSMRSLHHRLVDIDKTVMKKCRECEDVPPRSHHCKLCDICILKRDHHCWFAGYCVGYQNHRYYLMVIFYCWLAGVYATIYHCQFMIETLNFGLNLRSLTSLVAPHVVWVLGYYTLYEFFIAGILDVANYVEVLLSWLLIRQVLQIKNGQTAHERTTGDRQYQKGWRRNVEEILGRRWYLVWVAPCVPSDLPPVEDHWTGKKTD